MNICNQPFSTLHVHPNSYITCCPSWFTNRGEVLVPHDDDPWKVWNHENFQKLRKCWLERNKSLCLGCPIFLKDEWGIEKPLEYMLPIMKRGPREIIFANDPSCNLHCWSCRSKPIMEKQQERVFKQTKNILDTFKDSVRFISAIGSGDPLASPAWLKILQTLEIQKHKELEIELFTNGLLIPKYWGSLSHLHDNISTIKMSCDAATKDVYERTRLGGKFEEMQKAVRFVSKLGKKFTLNMVVQADNYTDIPDFINMAIENKATKVNLTMLKYWPQMLGGIDNYNDKDLSRLDHPKREGFVKVIESNMDLLTNPIVDCSKILEEGQILINSINQRRVEQNV